MTEEIHKKLSIIFYAMFFNSIVFAFLFYYFGKQTTITVITQTDMILQTIAILMLLVCVPVALKLYFTKVKALQNIENKEEKLRNYFSWNIVRLAFIEGSLFFSLIVYFITQNDSMLFCAGIAMMTLFLCKPNLNRIKEELNID